MNILRGLCILLGAVAYGWLWGTLAKEGMPDIMTLAGSILAPVVAGLVVGRPLLHAYTRMEQTSDKEKIVTMIAVTFLLLSVGIALGATAGRRVQKNYFMIKDKENERKMWKEDVATWNTILLDTTAKNKASSKLFEKYLKEAK